MYDELDFMLSVLLRRKVKEIASDWKVQMLHTATDHCMLDSVDYCVRSSHLRSKFDIYVLRKTELFIAPISYRQNAAELGR